MEYLIFDVDGVILDFQAGYKKHIEKQTTPALHSDNQNLVPTKNLEWEFINSPEFAQLPALVSSEKFNSLTAGKEVFFITNLPEKSFKNRKKNLLDLGFKFKEVFLGGFETYGEEEYPTKSEVLLQIVGRWNNFFFIDDYYENCYDVAKNFPNAKVCLMKGLYPFDKDSTLFQKIEGWDMLEKILIDL